MDGKRIERVFLVRMWQQDDRSAWRGSVHEVGSPSRLYVTGARDIADFIEVRLSHEPEPRTDP